VERQSVLDLAERLQNVESTLGHLVGGEILYGIKTGFNKAFIIGEEVRQQLIEADSKLDFVQIWT
jgi:hypothetical protein